MVCGPQALSDTVACTTFSPRSITDAISNLKEAISLARYGSAYDARKVGQSHVTTIILPHDLSWEQFQPENKHVHGGRIDPTAKAVEGPPSAILASHEPHGDPGSSQAAKHFITMCATALRGAARGKAALYLGGEALLDQSTGFE